MVPNHILMRQKMNECNVFSATACFLTYLSCEALNVYVLSRLHVPECTCAHPSEWRRRAETCKWCCSGWHPPFFFFSWSWSSTGMRWSSKKKKGSFLLSIRLNVAEFHTKPGREFCLHGDGRRGRGGLASESFSYVTEAHWVGGYYKTGS